MSLRGGSTLSESDGPTLTVGFSSNTLHEVINIYTIKNAAESLTVAVLA